MAHSRCSVNTYCGLNVCDHLWNDREEPTGCYRQFQAIHGPPNEQMATGKAILNQLLAKTSMEVPLLCKIGSGAGWWHEDNEKHSLCWPLCPMAPITNDCKLGSLNRKNVFSHHFRCQNIWNYGVSRATFLWEPPLFWVCGGDCLTYISVTPNCLHCVSLHPKSPFPSSDENTSVNRKFTLNPKMISPWKC